MGTKENPGAFDCYEYAAIDEPMFVLIARDRVAPYIVRGWAQERERLLRGSDVSMTAEEFFGEIDQITEARAVADQMEVWRAEEHRQ